MLDTIGADGSMQRLGLRFFPFFTAKNVAGFSKISRYVLALEMSRKWAKVLGRMTLRTRPFFFDDFEISNKN
jgi:hypothetical protein